MLSYSCIMYVEMWVNLSRASLVAQIAKKKKKNLLAKSVVDP